ncbi:MAG: hypothetical protein VYB34_10705 [Planctomycetota bacterium]|nr:hypothetical protein [Planctomycetota bacterium]
MATLLLLALLLLALLLLTLLLLTLLLLTLLLLTLLLLALPAAVGFTFEFVGKLARLTLELLLPTGETFVFPFAPLPGGVIPLFTFAAALERIFGILDIFLLVTAEAPQAFELLGNIANRSRFFPESLRLVLTLENEQYPLEVFLNEELFLESVLQSLLLQENPDVFQPRDNLQLAAANKSLLQTPGLFELILPGKKLPHQRDQPQKTPLDLSGKIFLLAIEANRIFRSLLPGVLDTSQAH